tara:strand:+ start:195566 stop:195793 length:228 start_codon:yes stop_codon:yes gene_type:complete
MNDYIKIITGSAITISRLEYLLNANNIETRVRDNVESARLAGFGAQQNDVELFVRSENVDKAQSIIAEAENEAGE